MKIKILIIFITMLVLFGIYTLCIPSKSPSDYVNELKLKIPETRQFILNNQENLNALLEFAKQNTNLGFDLYRDKTDTKMLNVGIYEKTGDHSVQVLAHETLGESKYISEDIKNVFKTLLNGTDNVCVFSISDGNVSIEYTRAINSRVAIRIKNTEIPYTNMDTDRYYSEMVNDIWNIEIEYWPPN